MILTVDEIHNGRDGEAEGGRGRAIYRYTRVFRVTTDSANDDASAVRAGLYDATGVTLGVQHPSHAAAYCQRVTPRNESFSKKVWIVTCGYSTERELAEDPLAIPAEVEWTTEPYTRAYYRDRNGQAMLNSAGYFYDPPDEGDDSRWVANVSKNVAAVPLWLKSYRDAVNADDYVLDGLAIAAGESKLMDMRLGKWQELNGIRFRTLSLSIALDEAGWDAVLLDQGIYEIDPADASKRRRITDDEGEPVDSPVPLDGAGHKLANPSPANAVFRTHPKYKFLPFAALPLA